MHQGPEIVQFTRFQTVSKFVNKTDHMFQGLEFILRRGIFLLFGKNGAATHDYRDNRVLDCGPIGP